MQQTTGMIHLYVGDGKGKTTAALGLAIRALGAGNRVLIAQFLKGRNTSELTPLRSLGIEIFRTEAITTFTFDMTDEEKRLAAKNCDCCFSKVEAAIAAKEYDMLVLDEVVDAVNAGMLPLERLLSLLKNRDPSLEIVMTGRNPKDEIVAAADYLTVMTSLKHPYQHGVKSRPGIEY